MVGVDIVSVARFERMLQRRPSIARRVFTPQEIALAQALPPATRAAFFAGRFAVKEAVIKALGLGAPIAWHEMECLASPSGAPALALSGPYAGLAGPVLHVSISNAAGIAAAIVVV